jgi:predicted kinase
VTRLTMLCGIPCSGKSTYVRDVLLKESPDSVVLSSDKFIDNFAKAKNKTYVEVFDEAIDPSLAELEKELKQAISEGKSIIWDQTNLTKESRTLKLSKVPESYEKLCVCFHIELKEALVRNSQRCKFIPREVLMKMNHQFVLPSESEGFNLITHLCYSDHVSN